MQSDPVRRNNSKKYKSIMHQYTTICLNLMFRTATDIVQLVKRMNDFKIGNLINLSPFVLIGTVIIVFFLFFTNTGYS